MNRILRKIRLEKHFIRDQWHCAVNSLYSQLSGDVAGAITISMDWCQKTPTLLTHRSYVFLSLSDRYNLLIRNSSLTQICPNINPHSPTVFKVCTEHSGETIVLCAKSQNHSTNKIDVMDERDCMRSEFVVIMWLFVMLDSTRRTSIPIFIP